MQAVVLSLIYSLRPTTPSPSLKLESLDPPLKVVSSQEHFPLFISLEIRSYGWDQPHHSAGKETLVDTPA